MLDALADIARAAFPVLALATWVLVPIYAFVQRGRSFALFSTVTFGISIAGAMAVHARLDDWMPAAALPWVDLAFAAAIVAAAVHYAHLVRARLRGEVFRRLVSAPGQAFVAASFLATFWLLFLLALRGPLWIAGFAGFDTAPLLARLLPLDIVPYVVGLVALATSARPVRELVRVELDGALPDRLTRVPVERHRRRAPEPLANRPLRIVQITDPHLGPWQPISRLAALVDDLLDREPDLVLLTGDFLTMESNGTPGALAAALAPLRRAPGRCYAVFGNHDHEAPDEVRAALRASGVELLVDDATTTPTPVGPVQIVGADFVRRDRAEHLRGLLERHPRIDGHLRLLLLHDPSAFHHLPDDDVDLVLSGHTHGGQIGLVSLGLDWTVLSMFGSRWPDHGLFARGRSRLYVHRGTGFYGFPLRIGVPGEASMLELIR